MDFDEYDYLEKIAAADRDENPPNSDKPPTPTSRSDATDCPRSCSSSHRDADDPTRDSRSKPSRPEEERGYKALHRKEERGDKDRHRKEERSSSRTNRDRHRSGRDNGDERNGKERDRERHDRVREKEREPRHGSRSRPERQAEEDAVRVVEFVPREPQEREHNSSAWT